MRQQVRELLEEYTPPPVPLERIERRARTIRLRRAGAAASAVALAVLTVVLVLSPVRSSPVASSGTVPVSITNAVTTSAGPGGVFASGTADGKHWQLAVQNIADPGYPCVPAVTVNGDDADPVFPNPRLFTPVGNPSFVMAGAWASDVGLAFVQVPASVTRLGLDPDGVGGLQVDMTPVTVTTCGERFRLAGFAYPLSGTIRLNSTPPGSVASYTAPTMFTDMRKKAIDGVWQNIGSAHDQMASAVLASGPQWAIQVTFGMAGDCYHMVIGPDPARELTDPGAAPSNYASTYGCFPVSTPSGPEAIAALYPPPANASGPQGIGYGVPVSPGTARLAAGLSDGSTIRATPVVVDGRKYAAVFVPSSCSLLSLTWLDAAGRVLASTTTLPSSYPYVEFQP